MLVNSSQVLEVLDLLAAEGVVGWLDGGWGVDALLGEQTRPHIDLDLAVDELSIDRLVTRLRAEGYTVFRNELPASIALRHDDGREVDLHPLALIPDGAATSSNPTAPRPGAATRRRPATSTAGRCPATAWTPRSGHLGS